MRAQQRDRPVHLDTARPCADNISEPLSTTMTCLKPKQKDMVWDIQASIDQVSHSFSFLTKCSLLNFPDSLLAYRSSTMAPSVLKAAALALRAVSTICPAQPSCPQNDGCSYTEPDGVVLTFSCSMSAVVSRDTELLARAVSGVCPASPSCPQDNQCSYTANKVSFQVNCATDYYGGDLQLARVGLT